MVLLHSASQISNDKKKKIDKKQIQQIDYKSKY